MTEPKRRGDREELERALEERSTEQARQSSGSTPPEPLVERALDIEPGVEQHAGEDAGQVPRDDDET
jgi:hypothetical protein